MTLDPTALATLVGLFIILSPGLIVTIPALTVTDLTNLGVGYDEDSPYTTPLACTSAKLDVEGCKKATSWWLSGYTTALAVFVHAVIFALILSVLPRAGLGPMFGFNTQSGLE
jgi:hypothetical protein